MGMSALDIWIKYGVKPDVYKYILEIGANPLNSNDYYAKQLNVSPQMVGRVTRELENLGHIVNVNSDKTTLKSSWVIDQGIYSAVSNSWQ